MGPAIVGTLLITAARLGHGDPARHPRAPSTSTSTASRGRFARVVRFMSDVMTGVPSIVHRPVHLLGLGAALRPVRASAGAFALACLMLPIVIRSTEEMLRLVPDELRQASYAAREPRVAHHLLGRAARRPSAASSAARCWPSPVPRGETAPLLFTIGVVTASQRRASAGPTPPCRSRSSATPRAPTRWPTRSPGPRPSRSSAWCSCSPCSSRLISARFASKRA